MNTSMKYYGYKFLLQFLRILMYGKRAVVFLWQKGVSLGDKGFDFYKNTLGFRFYKLFFFFRKKFVKFRIPWNNRIVEFFARRGTLQFFLLLTGVAIMIPHSKIYTRDSLTLPGRQTIFYSLVGPGEQDFEIEEVGVEVTNVQPQYVELWREGAIGFENTNGTGNAGFTTPEEIAGLGAGGSAVVAPTIMPGSVPVPTEQTPRRTAIVMYTVQSGDVIGSIARKFGISIDTILWANNLNVRSSIHPGDTLKILPLNGVVHKVQKGDTIGKIAQKYGVKSDEVTQFNDLSQDGRGLVIGTEIVIPNGQRAEPVYLVTPRSATPKPTVLNRIVAPRPSIEVPAGVSFVWPTESRRINQYFGLRHTGVDIHGKMGASNYAAKAGKVIKSQCGWNGGYGCYVILDHGGGVTTLYAHNSQLMVSVGESVKQGQVVGLLGSTGRSTGPHLHFEVRVSGGRANPLKYIR